jgi:hypothetical protein
MRLTLVAAACFGAVLAADCARGAPTPAPATAREAIDRLIDSARAVGLPTGPLISKVREGESKGASDERILGAVQAQLREEAAPPRRP